MTQLGHAVITWLKGAFIYLSSHNHIIVHHFTTQRAHKNNLPCSLITVEYSNAQLLYWKKEGTFLNQTLWRNTNTKIGDIHKMWAFNVSTLKELFRMRICPQRPDDSTSSEQTRLLTGSETLSGKCQVMKSVHIMASKRMFSWDCFSTTYHVSRLCKHQGASAHCCCLLTRCREVETANHSATGSVLTT